LALAIGYSGTYGDLRLELKTVEVPPVLTYVLPKIGVRSRAPTTSYRVRFWMGHFAEVYMRDRVLSDGASRS